MSDISKNDSKNDQKKKSTTPLAKRIAALVCVVLLISLYVVTFLVAIFDKSSSGRWFMVCLLGTVAIPLLTWIYIWMYGVLTQKHTIASFDILQKNKDPESESLLSASEDSSSDDH